MKVLTANRLADGRVIYADDAGGPVDSLAAAGMFDDDAAERVLELTSGRPDVFVNPYLVEVSDHRPNGRDRLKETIRSAGPTVGHSLGAV